MPVTQKVKWPGLSKREYEYEVYPLGTSFKEQPGNYIFAKVAASGYWTACYIGQSENLEQRLGDHEKEAHARSLGATHIHAHLTTSGEAMRKAEESDLIQNCRPPCNVQLV